ncbi:glucose-6-phosphate dehydrogenase [Nakamurella lactea]|uniref:glucose-6-phosphate dehydrogenase n=1 Tax=Nakamurella lactea TaxID=459515 RepID=UPI00041B4E97|nr:glucose-6-phosphate dehydrogenase [Nakamurella lactea]
MAQRSVKKTTGRGTASSGPRGGDRQTLLILGASGDLTGRLLLPGVGGLLACDRGRDLLLLGSGMEPWTQAKWHKRVTDAFATQHAKGALVTKALADTSYTQADVTDPEQLKMLLDKAVGPVSIFFALPPAVTALACQALTKVDLPRDTRLVMEKPFGTDAASAAKLNELVLRLVPEENVFRIDHFLGKSTVLNLLGFRFANRLFEPVLNNLHVAKMEIVFDEDLGLESRAGYYDGAGALVDMIQSHLLQIMTLLTMEAPPTLTAGDLRDRKAEILRATRVWADDPVGSSRRARYTAGRIGRRKLAGYAASPGVDPARKTETLAEMTVEVNTWRWAGVPITLRSGKALSTRRKEAVITFKPAPRLPDGFHGSPQPERLHIGFGPDQMRLQINVNGPGDPMELDPHEMVVDFGPGELSAYGEVLAGVLDNDPGLAVRGDSAVDCWRVVAPVLRAWKADKVPLDSYPAGSTGPRKWKETGGDPQA